MKAKFISPFCRTQNVSLGRMDISNEARAYFSSTSQLTIKQEGKKLILSASIEAREDLAELINGPLSVKVESLGDLKSDFDLLAAKHSEWCAIYAIAV